jgi:hypothetical protein
MTSNQALTDVIDETIQALASLDLAKLQKLEARAAELQQSDLLLKGVDRDVLLAKKRVLELVLRNNESTLDVLDRVSGRNVRN